MTKNKNKNKVQLPSSGCGYTKTRDEGGMDVGISLDERFPLAAPSFFFGLLSL